MILLSRREHGMAAGGDIHKLLGNLLVFAYHVVYALGQMGTPDSLW
jgi:hypothetical protein